MQIVKMSITIITRLVGWRTFVHSRALLWPGFRNANKAMEWVPFSPQIHSFPNASSPILQISHDPSGKAFWLMRQDGTIERVSMGKNIIGNYSFFFYKKSNIH